MDDILWQVRGATKKHHTALGNKVRDETGFHYVAQAGLEVLIPPQPQMTVRGSTPSLKDSLSRSGTQLGQIYINSLK